MDRRSHRVAPIRPLVAGVLAGLLIATAAMAQAPRPGAGGKVAGGADRGAPGIGAGARARPAGEDFQAGIRKTVERRRRRRARRASARGGDEGRPPGAIVPWPMPPALIIRQTPQVHDEIDSLLGQLRRAR